MAAIGSMLEAGVCLFLFAVTATAGTVLTYQAAWFSIHRRDLARTNVKLLFVCGVIFLIVSTWALSEVLVFLFKLSRA